MPRELWACPDCGRRFANANQWHSCRNAELTDILASASDTATATFEAIEAAIRLAGDFRIHPQKTRIAFISRMTFASVTLARKWVDLSFIVERPIDDMRIRRIELYGPTSWAHHVRVQGPAEVDPAVHRWLARALRRGDQQTLRPDGPVEPLAGRPLETVTAPLRSQVVAVGDRLAFRLPRHVAEAFADHPAVVARIGGSTYTGMVSSSGGSAALVLDEPIVSMGLGAGDPADIHVTADL